MAIDYNHHRTLNDAIDAMPGIPSIFWDHVCDWGDDCRERIKVLLKLRQKAEIKARQGGPSGTMVWWMVN